MRVTSPAGRPARCSAAAIRLLISSSGESAMAYAIGRAMRPRHPLPRLWLMTDERQGDRLADAVERLPEDGGIVFRHYGLIEVARRNLFDAVRAAHPGLLLLAGPATLAESWAPTEATAEALGAA